MNYSSVSNTVIVKLKMKYKHLDSEYRRRWELYHTENKIYDSRKINYKDIHDEVIKIVASVEGKVYTLDISKQECKGLIRWRFGGFHFNGRVKIDEWCIGYHDEETCFMKVIQFKDGSMEEKEYPYADFKVHLGDKNNE